MILLAAAGATAGGPAQHALDGLLAILGAWAVVEALIFDGSALEWVSFATALAGVAIAAIGLVIHEMTTERVVHELSVRPAGDRAPTPIA